MDNRLVLAAPRRSGRSAWSQGLVAGVLVVLVGQTALAQTQQLPAVVITADPAAPVPVDPIDGTTLDGSGPCVAYRQTVRPDLYFPHRAPDYPASVAAGTEPFANSMNDFMDGVGTTIGSGKTLFEMLQTPFDLAAYNLPAGQSAVGDFVNTVGCPADPS